MLRIPPEVHGAALVVAQVKGMSLNQWASQALREAADICIFFRGGITLAYPPQNQPFFLGKLGGLRGDGV